MLASNVKKIYRKKDKKGTSFGKHQEREKQLSKTQKKEKKEGQERDIKSNQRQW